MPNDTIQGYRLSPQQAHLWKIEQACQSDAFFDACVVRVEGELDQPLLRRAIEQLIARNEILRTSFACLPEMALPLQVISKCSDASIEELDLTGLHANEQGLLIEELFRRARGGFDSARHLFSLKVVALAKDKYAMILSLRALCADSITLKNIVRELSGLYESFLNNQEFLKEPFQYADLSEIFIELLESEETESGRQFWRKKGLADRLDLKPAFELQPSGTGFQPESVAFEVDAATATGVEARARQYQVSEAAFLLTCWQTLLWRLTEQPELTIGMTCEGRNFEGLGEAIGLFARILPLACRIEHGAPFSEVLKNNDAAIQQLLNWQEYFDPRYLFEPRQNQPSCSFFPVGFSSEKRHAEFAGGPITFQIEKQFACISRFKLQLSCAVQKSGLAAAIHYDCDLFKREDIERLGKQFQVLLASAVQGPEQDVGLLNPISEDERRKLLFEFNDTPAPYETHQCVHNLIEQRAASSPDAIAIEFNNERASYGQINSRANQLASYLRRLGVGPETPVGLCLERSVDMVIAILGTLKAGGAYVPLAPDYPNERLIYMVTTAQVRVVLTRRAFTEKIDEQPAWIVYLDEEWETISQEPAENPHCAITSGNLAYVIFTSGSTGRPKGVMITHRSLVNYLSWCTKAYNVADGEGAPVHSPIGFDLTVTSLFSPLLAGRTTRLLSEQEGIETLSNVLSAKSDFSLIKLTPAHLDLLSQIVKPEAAAGATRSFIIGGEALMGSSLTFWQVFAPETRLINEYGPTETVVGCCVYEVGKGETISGAVPIGKPIANTRIYILDSHLQPVPTGGAGEIYIGGDGLSRGYINGPDLTSEKFIPDAYAQEPGGRLYRTGDQGLHQADGNLQYLGRNDSQVKIRGYRIELSEIESTLRQHELLAEAVVIAREDAPGDKRLVAYVIANQAEELNISELRTFLMAKLPDFMVPSVFVTMKVLPLTVNGKVDRQSLPRPDELRPKLKAAFLAPRNNTEQALADIWKELLHVDTVGVDDNFFDLGGHSLLMVQVHRRLQPISDHQVPLLDLFQYPTISALSSFLDNRQSQPDSLDEVKERAKKQKAAIGRQKQAMSRRKAGDE